MRKIFSFFMLWLMCLGISTTASATTTIPADGIYQVFWEFNNRGYLTYAFRDYPNEAQLADVTLSGCENKHYKTANDGKIISKLWYLYTSKTTGQKYLFTVKDGKFLGKGADNFANTLSAEPTPIVIEQSGHSQAANYLQIKSGDRYLGSGCGSEKNQHPVRWNDNSQISDGGTPLKFVPAPADSTIDEAVKSQAIAKIDQVTIVTDLQQVNANKAYTLKATRGFLNAGNTLGASASQTADSKFAFVTKDNGANYALYSVSKKKFLKSDGSFTLQPESFVDLENITAEKGENNVVIQKPSARIFFKNETNKNINVITYPKLATTINYWKNVDQGNDFQVNEVEAFDPSMALMGASKMQADGRFDAHMQWFRINIGNRILNLGDDGNLRIDPADAEKKVSQLFSFVRTADNKYVVYNYAAGPEKTLWCANGNDGDPVQIANISGNVTNRTWVLAANGDGFSVRSDIPDDNNNRYWNSYGGGGATQIKIWKNNGGANDGSNRFYFHNVNGEELASYLSNQVTVTYSYTFNGKVLNKKQQVTAVVGAAFPRVDLPVSYITAQYPDRKITAADANKEIEIGTAVAANLPFKLSADVQHLEWNAIKYKHADNKWLANETAGVKLSGLASGTDVDNNLWAFVGDWANGYKIYNKKDQTKVLVAGNLDNNAGAQRHATLKDAATATETESRWTIENLVNGTKNVDFCLKLKNDAEVATYLGDHTGDDFFGCWTNNSGNSNANCKFNFQAYVPEALPVAGKNYFFVNLNSNGNSIISKQYYYDNNQSGTLDEAYGNGIDYNHVAKNYKKYVWRCVSANGGKYVFKNLATGRFLDWKKMSTDSQAEWILNSIVGNTGKEGAIRQGCVTMWKVGQKFLVRKHSENKFDQAGNAGYNDGDFSSDFKFEECTVAEAELLEEKDIFSTQYGEKWLRVDFNRDNNYTMKVNAAGVPCTAQDNFGNSDDLQWCFVKEADNLTFKIYSKQQASTKALNVENGNEATAVTFVDAANACTWRLVDKGANGFAIVPTNNATLSQSMNAFQGVNKVLKLYAVTDNGSWWMPAQISVHPFTFKTAIQGESYPVNTRIGRVGLNVGRAVNFTVNKGLENAVTYYLPVGTQVALNAAVDYRGYKFVGFKTAAGQLIPSGESVEYTAEGMDLTAVFEADQDNKYQYLFYSRDDKGNPYRIPAMVTAKNGDIIAISDNRPCGMDIGYGEVDVKYRISTDGGQNWGPEGFVADGLGEGENKEFWKIGFGDAAVVADRESNKVLIMMVCGKTVCHHGNYIPSGAQNAAQSSPNRVARVYAEYDEAKKVWNFSPVEEVTNTIYPLFDNADHTQTSVQSLFIGSGRICQSRVTKKGTHYRIYCAVWTKNEGNRVLYSDNFGESWHILGTAEDRPAPQGDEPKCEELPDGRVILSSRKGGGRYFNIFTFNDDSKTTGSWGQVVASNEQTGGISDNGQATNGEIISVQAMNMAGETKTLMLQSEPWGPGRSNVGIYFKEIDPNANYTPATFAQHWNVGLQVSDRGSAYSTMTILPNGNVGFFFEENPSDYCMVYRELNMKEITKGAYTFVGDDLRPANIAAAEEVLSKKGVGYPMSGSEDLQTALDNYKKVAHSKETFNALQKAMNDYKSDVTNIQMPEDGKAYTFAGVLRNGTKRYMNCNENGVTWVADANQATPWICRVIDANAHTYAFVNNDNRFSIWSGIDSGFNENKGYNPTFEADKCIITIEKMMKGGQVQPADQAELFGYVTYKGLRNRNNGVQHYMVNKTDDTFSKDGAGEPFFNNRFSSALLMEEVPYANTPKLNPIVGDMVNIKGAKTISTFSAPFATVVPQNVSAFYIKKVDKKENTAILTAVAGQTIPAKTGVILTSKNTTNALMVPSTETVEAIADNALAHTAGADKVFTAEEAKTFYLLGKYEGNVGFFLGNAGTLKMNKAYLPVSDGNAQAIKLVFGDDATGIEGIIAEENANAPIYDLSGRRVLNTVKGGVYIQNGKKFIVR